MVTQAAPPLASVERILDGGFLRVAIVTDRCLLIGTAMADDDSKGHHPERKPTGPSCLELRAIEKSRTVAATYVNLIPTTASRRGAV